MIEPEYIYKWSKVILSFISLIFISTHVIGSCQLFVFILNLYMLVSNVFWLILSTNGYTIEFATHVPLLGVENVITLASFMCMAGNTEDGVGMGNYEIVAVTSGILWGIHTSYMTYIITKDQMRVPYHYSDLEENFEI